MPRGRNPNIDKAQELYKKGNKLIDISNMLGIAEGTIRSWKNGYNWDEDNYKQNIGKVENSKNEKIKKIVIKHAKEKSEKVNKDNKTLYFKMLKELNKIIYDEKSSYTEKIKACELITKFAENRKLGYKINKLGRKIDLQGTTAISEEEWKKSVDYFRNEDNKQCCAYCGKETEKLEKDHIKPLSKGGKASYRNIIPSCKECNVLKNNKDLIEWYLSSNVYDEERLDKIISYIDSGEGE